MTAILEYLKFIEYEKINQNEIFKIKNSTNIETFIENIQNCIQLHNKIIVKQKKLHQKIKKPWITDTILNLIKWRNLNFKLKNKFPNNIFYNDQFKQYRNSIDFNNY